MERKVDDRRRARYRLLTETAGFAPEDIILDPNIFAIATGIEEHARYAVAFFEATRRLKAELPDARVSGGVSNVSFAFRGNDRGPRGDPRGVPVPRDPRRAWTWASSTPARCRSTTTSTPDLLRAGRGRGAGPPARRDGAPARDRAAVRRRRRGRPVDRGPGLARAAGRTSG